MTALGIEIGMLLVVLGLAVVLLVWGVEPFAWGVVAVSVLALLVVGHEL